MNKVNIKRIGILGGTFNPVHNGHLLIAEEAREKFKLSEVLFIPVNNPPHKNIPNLLNAGHRLNMVKLAIKDNPGFRASDIEIERGGKSYSIETIKSLKKIYNQKTKFYFIIGIDSMLEFMTWKNWDDLLKLCNFVVFPRHGYKFYLESLENKMSKILKNRSLLKKIIFFQADTFNVSSTQIRFKIKEGESVKYLLPEKVIEYIQKNKLY